MLIRKSLTVVRKTATAQDLTLINEQTKKPLKEDEVYTFSVRLCDDQPDRDHERFSVTALGQLAKLFIGKPGIFDHFWTAHEQTARIYDAAVEKIGGATCLMAKAYLLKTDANEEIIAAIDGGILKEVSIACAMRKATCTVCGKPYGSCDHRKGVVYGEDTCYAELSEAVDAYEFSFVAVPAQPKAGVVKGADKEPAQTVTARRDPTSVCATGADDSGKTMSTEEADRAHARLRLEKLRFGG